MTDRTERSFIALTYRLDSLKKAQNMFSHKLNLITSQQTALGHYQPARETPLDGGQLLKLSQCMSIRAV